ncbi:MAG: glycosyltransferase family 39 protein [Dysgonomonas sp.]
MEKKRTSIDYGIILGFLFFSFLFVFFNSRNSPLYLFSPWGDVHIYFSMGKGIANGLIPYKDIFDHKGPFIFFIYSVAYLISNTNLTGVYLLEAVALFFNILFAYKTARLYTSQKTASIVGLIYALFIFNKSYFGGSAEEFISVFVTISFYYFIAYFRNSQQDKSESRKQMIVHGIMFALVLLSKLSVCIFWVPLLLAIYIDLLKEKKYRETINYILYSLFGVVVTLLPFILYFTLNNSLKDFYWGYIQFNSIYAEFQPDLSVIRKILSHFYKLTITDYISFPLTLLGVVLLCFSKKYIQNIIFRIGILFSFIFSFSIICITKYIMTYAHIVIYVYAIFGVIFILSYLTKFIEKYFYVIYAVTFICLLLMGIENKAFFGEEKDCLLRKKECGYMQKEFADIIKKEQNPTLLNIGLDLGVYTEANIVPTYKYFFYPNIPYHLCPEIRDYQMQLIADKKPMFVVMGDNAAFF